MNSKILAIGKIALQFFQAKSQRLFPIIIAFLVLGSILSVSAKVGIDGIEVTLSKTSDDLGDDDLEINVGEKFYIHIKLEDPDDTKSNVDVDIEITIAGKKVYDDDKTIDLVKGEDNVITIASNELDYDDLWGENLMGYDCGKNKRVEVDVSKDVSSKSDRATLDIAGDDLNVDIKPEKPTPDDKITITVTDEDDDELKDITVRFTHLGDNNEWDKDDENWDDETDKDGEVEVKLSEEDEFKDDPYGKYQIDVWEENGDYCKYTTIIDARHLLKVSDPEPAQPMAGQDIKVRVTDEGDNPVIGANVAVSGPGGLQGTYNTDAQGYTTFKVDSPGTFDIVATKTDYSDSDIKHITVLEKNAIGIIINPTDQEVGKGIEISITGTGGSALKGAKVTITKPDGTTEEFTTPDNGKISYTPTSTGTYKLKAEAPLYATTTKEFRAHNVFKVNIPDTLLPDVDITITVENQESKPVSGASVSIQETSVSGNTDDNGKFTFSLIEPKEYTMIVKKDGYPDAIQKINIQGVLSLILSSKEIDLDETIEFVIKDSQGNPITANIEVIKPNGEKESIAIGESGYKPSIAGKYTISASKSGYKTVTDTFTVNPYPLVLKSRMEGTNLVVIAISSEKPVSNITISFDVGQFHKEIITNENGKAILDIIKENITGNVTIAAIDQNYEKTTTVQEAKPAGGDYTILILILVVLITIIIAVLFISRGGRKKKEKGRLVRTTGSTLDKV